MKEILPQKKDFEEIFLLVFFLLIGIFILWGSLDFPYEIAILPRISSVIVIVGCVFLLAKPYLPISTQKILSDAPNTNEGTHDKKEEPMTKAAMVTSLLLIFYIISGYLVGFLWATPLFVLLFGLHANIPLKSIILLAILSFLIALGFVEILNAPFEGGEILNA